MLVEPLLDLCKRCSWIDIARDDKNRVAWRVPVLIELLQHFTRGRIEGTFRTQRVVCVRSPGEHILIQAVDELVSRIGKIARHFLLDRAAFLRPFLL